MRSHARRAAAALAVAALVISGCGGTEDETAASETAASEQAAVPELVSMLVTADDLDGEWVERVNPMSESGEVTEEMREDLPTIEFCDSASAEAQAAAEGSQWQAFRQLGLTVDDPMHLTPEGATSGRIIIALEGLLASDAGEVEATFEALKSGLESCAGQTTVDEDGATLTLELWGEVPEVGDDWVGVLGTEEAPEGGEGFVGGEVLVRDGSVLMWVRVIENFTGEGVTPQLTADQFAAIVTTAAAKIG